MGALRHPGDHSGSVGGAMLPSVIVHSGMHFNGTGEPTVSTMEMHGDNPWQPQHSEEEGSPSFS